MPYVTFNLFNVAAQNLLALLGYYYLTELDVILQLFLYAAAAGQLHPRCFVTPRNYCHVKAILN